MSYADEVNKKMLKNKLASSLTGQKNVSENSSKDRLRNKIAGEVRGQQLNLASKSKDDLNTQKSGIQKQSKRLKSIRTAIKAGTDGTKTSASIKNTNRKSPRFGQYYTIDPGKGGNYHVYGNGKRVFVRSKKKHGNTNTPVFKGKGLNNKEYLANA